jgi:hypothetical protein
MSQAKTETLSQFMLRYRELWPCSGAAQLSHLDRALKLLLSIKQKTFKSYRGKACRRTIR